MKIKYSELEIKKGNKTYFYVCNTVEWNWFLNRYYPNAELITVIEPLK